MKTNNKHIEIIEIAKYVKTLLKAMSQKITYTPITVIGLGCQNLNNLSSD
ncbi:hypothetical protein [Pseudanabaena minima]